MSTDQILTSTCKGELSHFHKFFYYRTCLEFSSCVYIAVQYNNLPEISELYSALATVLNDNPPLCLQVFAEGDDDPNVNEIVTDEGVVRPDPPTSVYVAPLNEIDFSKAVVIDKSLNIHDKTTIDMLIGKRFEFGSYTRPLWKFFIVKDNWVVFSFDHTLLDGISGVIIHKQLITALNLQSQTMKEPNEKFPIYHPRAFESSADLAVVNVYEKRVLTWSISASNFLNSRVKPFLINFANRIVETCSLDPSILGTWYMHKANSKYLIQKNKFEDNYFEINIPQNDTLKLIKLAKKHGNISMNTLMCSLFLLSAKDVFVFSEQAIKFFFPVNARSLLNMDKDKLGLLLKTEAVISPVLKNNLKTKEHLNQQNFWHFALNIQKQMSKQIPMMEGIERINRMSLQDSIADIKSTINTTPIYLFAHSNLGLSFNEEICSNTNKYKFSIENALFNQSQLFTNCFQINTVSTLKGGTNTQIGCPDEFKEEVDQIIVNYKRFFKELLSTC